MALVARDRNLEPPLTGAYLNIAETVSPGQKLPEEYAGLWLSRDQNKDAPILNQPLIDFMLGKPFSHFPCRTRFTMELFSGQLTIWYRLAECYKPDLQSHYFAPAHHPQGHAGLPKTYIDVCGLDPFRDDGIIYEQMLRDAGVATKLSVFPGLPHGWWMVMPELAATKEYHEKTRQGLEWLLKKKSSS